MKNLAERNENCPCGSERKFKKCCLELFTTDFSKITDEKANELLERKMKYVELDLYSEIDIFLLYEQLDRFKRYSDIITIIAKYPDFVSTYYETTSTIFNYSIEYEWDWNITDKEKELLKSTVLSNEKTSKMKLADLIRDRLNGIFKTKSKIQLGREMLWKKEGYPVCKEKIKKMQTEVFTDDEEQYFEACSIKERGFADEEDSEVSWEDIFDEVSERYPNIYSGLEGVLNICSCNPKCGKY
jgi:hypothetical protein